MNGWMDGEDGRVGRREARMMERKQEGRKGR